MARDVKFMFGRVVFEEKKITFQTLLRDLCEKKLSEYDVAVRGRKKNRQCGV